MMDERNVLPEMIIKYNVDVEEDLHITQMNIKEVSLKAPGIKSKWLMCYINERRILNVFKAQEDKMIQDYIDSHMGRGQVITSLKFTAMKTDAVKLVHAKIVNQQDIVDYLEGVVKIFQGLDFTLKNTIDVIKLEAGM